MGEPVELRGGKHYKQLLYARALNHIFIPRKACCSTAISLPVIHNSLSREFEFFKSGEP